MKLIQGTRYTNAGNLILRGWTVGDGSDTTGYSYLDFFSPDGAYLGPDEHDIEPIVERPSYLIGLNARQDLYEAGFMNYDQQVADFEDAYIAAAESYAKEHNVEIDVLCGNCSAQLQGADTSEQAGKIWQDIHDLVAWSGPRAGDPTPAGDTGCYATDPTPAPKIAPEDIPDDLAASLKYDF